MAATAALMMRKEAAAVERVSMAERGGVCVGRGEAAVVATLK
jgi:hypothetical protein